MAPLAFVSGRSIVVSQKSHRRNGGMASASPGGGKGIAGVGRGGQNGTEEGREQRLSTSGGERGEDWQCGSSALLSKCEAQEEVQKAGREPRGRILPRGWKTGITEGDRRAGLSDKTESRAFDGWARFNVAVRES
uniref:Uncharacterized protein n=1 Tax=Physcomitrium patens TaxID=3218 RepID=A0A2K1IQG9_PHYPA|nr:hypothetical protein PHYPA_025644 [Physcomitrium patens]PNR31524.1 hypothetical protein PHYPA_025645 [Physcomitrium patens]